jgi:hypothetical protein
LCFEERSTKHEARRRWPNRFYRGWQGGRPILVCVGARPVVPVAAPGLLAVPRVLADPGSGDESVDGSADAGADGTDDKDVDVDNEDDGPDEDGIPVIESVVGIPEPMPLVEEAGVVNVIDAMGVAEVSELVVGDDSADEEPIPPAVVPLGEGIVGVGMHGCGN